MNGQIVKLPIKQFANEYLKVDRFENSEFYKRYFRKLLPRFYPTDKVWLAGGIWRRQFSHEENYTTDIDLFFSSKIDMEIYKNLCHFSWKDKQNYYTYKRSYWAESQYVSHICSDDIDDIDVEVQFIHGHYFEDAKTLLENFNFTVNQFAFDGSYMYFNPVGLWDIKLKQLHMVDMNTRPSSTQQSLNKFIAYGYTIDAKKRDELGIAADIEQKAARAAGKDLQIWLS